MFFSRLLSLHICKTKENANTVKTVYIKSTYFKAGLGTQSVKSLGTQFANVVSYYHNLSTSCLHLIYTMQVYFQSTLVNQILLFLFFFFFQFMNLKVPAYNHSKI